MLIVLVALCVEWAVYHRDAVIRVRRSLSGAAPAAARRRDRLMGIAFDEPLWLLLLIPALALTIGLHLAARRRMGAGRRRAALVVRTVLLTALVLALAGFQLVLPVDRLATVFVVDLSDSVGNAGRSEALAFLRETLKEKPQGDVAGIVAFGKDALVERLPSELEDIDRIASTPVETATDIGAALRLATALFPDDAQKRIVLLSDGNDTTGGGQAEAALAASRGIRIETRPIGLGDVDEVLVERLTTPSTARLGESIEAVAEIRSSVAQPATVRLFADGGARRHAAGPARGGRHPRHVRRQAHRGRLPHVPGRRRGRPRHVQPERPGRLEHHRQGRAADAGPRRRRPGRQPSWSRRSRRSASRSTRWSPRRCRPTSPAWPPTTASCSSTSRGSASTTGSWPRSRSTSATSARGW